MAKSYLDKKNRILDLDAAQAERLQKDDAQGSTPPKVKIGGITYELPLELPAGFLVDLGRVQGGDMSKLGNLLDLAFGKENAQTVLDAMKVEDLKNMMDLLPELYGADEGEAEDSSPS